MEDNGTEIPRSLRLDKELYDRAREDFIRRERLRRRRLRVSALLCSAALAWATYFLFDAMHAYTALVLFWGGYFGGSREGI